MVKYVDAKDKLIRMRKFVKPNFQKLYEGAVEYGRKRCFSNNANSLDIWAKTNVTNDIQVNYTTN